MIAKAHRFHGHGSLRFVYQRGETLRGQFGSLKYVRNPRRQTYRMAVVVSRKVHKSAVVRNRIRRRMYEIVRHVEPLMIEPFDLVFTVFSDQVAALESAELSDLILTKLVKAGVIHMGGIASPGADALAQPQANSTEEATNGAPHVIVEPKEIKVS